MPLRWLTVTKPLRWLTVTMPPSWRTVTLHVRSLRMRVGTWIFIPFSSTGWKALMITCYAPLYLWGPALLVVTWAYYRRRVSAPAALVSAR